MKQQTTSTSADEGDCLPEDWVDEHADALYQYACARVQDRHVAEDLVQEAYLAAYTARGSFRGQASLRTWLIGILRLKVVDYYRRKSRESTTRQQQEEKAADVYERESRLKAWDCAPNNTLEKQEFWVIFRACVGKLPESLSAAFMLREMDRCSTSEICQLLSITSKNLGVRLFRARSALRDCLDKNWFSTD